MSMFRVAYNLLVAEVRCGKQDHPPDIFSTLTDLIPLQTPQDSLLYQSAQTFTHHARLLAEEVQRCTPSARLYGRFIFTNAARTLTHPRFRNDSCAQADESHDLHPCQKKIMCGTKHQNREYKRCWLRLQFKVGQGEKSYAG